MHQFPVTLANMNTTYEGDIVRWLSSFRQYRVKQWGVRYTLLFDRSPVGLIKITDQITPVWNGGTSTMAYIGSDQILPYGAVFAYPRHVIMAQVSPRLTGSIPSEATLGRKVKRVSTRVGRMDTACAWRPRFEQAEIIRLNGGAVQTSAPANSALRPMPWVRMTDDSDGAFGMWGDVDLNPFYHGYEGLTILSQNRNNLDERMTYTTQAEYWVTLEAKGSNHPVSAPEVSTDLLDTLVLGLPNPSAQLVQGV